MGHSGGLADKGKTHERIVTLASKRFCEKDPSVPIQAEHRANDGGLRQLCYSPSTLGLGTMSSE